MVVKIDAVCSGEGDFRLATVPGCVHTDLMANGLIDDPFYRLNEHNVQWIDKVNWIYKTEFDIDSSILSKEFIVLNFEGLDTFAEVNLNGKDILRSDNMFRTWKVDIKANLVEGANRMEIRFLSPIQQGINIYEKLDYHVPCSGNDLASIGKVEGNKMVSNLMRKAPYHFGWDWGPRLVSSGIWKDIYVRAWNVVSIDNIKIEQLVINSELAKLKAVVALNACIDTDLELKVIVDDTQIGKSDIRTDQFKMESPIFFEISKPKLWWPNGMGEQNLYKVRIEVWSSKNPKLLDAKEETIGLRTIKLIQENDKKGQTFFFEVNGRPTFMKGANYIPQDIFLNRVTPERYEHIVRSAVTANMNMMRVWGGGIYEKDIFYDLCDRHGILIWQEFMFACSMYPGDEDFLENVRQEAVDNVRRLRNHPCIALWCGNNEVFQGWYWGVRQRTVDEQGQKVADIIWKAYTDTFHTLLPEILALEDGNRPYWSSSPTAGMGKVDNLVQGDHHYWDVWGKKAPFSSFKANTGRFMSEYGFQSFCEMKTIKTFALPQDFDIHSEVMKSHQRSGTGNDTIKLYMDRDYNPPKDFESFVYLTQVLQGEAIKRAIQLHRVQMPYNMGSLFWQIDDCWPVASWSSIDCYGRWKALHYMARKVYKSVIIVPEPDEKDKSTTNISIVSDLPESVEATLKCTIFSFDGKIISDDELDFTVNGSSSVKVASFPCHTQQNVKCFAHFLLIKKNDHDFIDEEIWYFVPPKDMQLSTPTISMDVCHLGEQNFEVTLISDVLAKNVFLSCLNGDGSYSDNYFDMLPRIKYVIRFESKDEMQETPEFAIRDLTSSYLR